VADGVAPPAARPRLPWREAEVVEVIAETPRARSLVLRVPEWPGHLPGQHVDVRLTAEDGYQTERSYSIASPPEQAELVLTVERIDDGEVSPFLTDEVRVADRLELRGPIGGYFVWSADVPGPLQLLARADPRLAVVHTLTRERPDGWRGRLGRVDAAMLDAVAFPAAEAPASYVCGPTSFVEAVASALVAAGHPAARVKTERFGPTGVLPGP
jgi:ferredoxin-NADP reductase